MTIIYIIQGFILNFVMIIGFIGWFYMFLVLLQLVLCKDATEPNASKLLNRPIKVRIRLFRRSLRDPWYVASCGLFIAVCILIGRLGFEFIHNVSKPVPLIFFHGLFAPCLGWLYYQRGYKAVFFVKMGEFLQGRD